MSRLISLGLMLAFIPLIQGTASAVILSTWAFVDGNKIYGINKSTGNWAFEPKLTVFNSKLYATWNEYAQVRVAVYNGNDTGPAWNFVDGGGTYGINRGEPGGSPDLTVFDSRLYVTWSENDQIRVAVYNGNDSCASADDCWDFVDGNETYGINYSTPRSAYFPQLTVFNSKLYAAWHETVVTNFPWQIRVAVYNGNDANPAWNFVDGNGTYGLSKNTAKNAEAIQLTVFDSRLYATWAENDAVADKPQIRVAVYNGNDAGPVWSFVDGGGTYGINKNTGKKAGLSQLTVFDSKLYASWIEYAISDVLQIRTAVYNGNDAGPAWSFVDGGGTDGINKNTGNSVFEPQLTVFNSRLYTTWDEVVSSTEQVRVAVYNGNDSCASADDCWDFIDGNGIYGINRNPEAKAYSSQLIVFDSKLYALWAEDQFPGIDSGQIRVAKLVQSARETVAPGAGETITFDPPSGEVKVKIPPDTFKEAIEITVRVPAPQDVPLPTGDLKALPTPVNVELELDKPVELARDVTISVTYRDSDVGGLDENTLVVARYDTTRSAWVALPSVRDTVNNKVTANTNHFSLFQIMEGSPAQTLSSVTIGPNPLRPNLKPGQVITFRNLPSGARVRIYTYLGELLHDTHEDGTGIATWDGKNKSGRQAASGIYIAFIEGAGEKKTLKLAIQK